MADNIRDRVLALRILPPRLLETLKKKITQKEEVAASDAAKAAAASSAANAKYNHERAAMGMGSAPSTAVQNKEGQITDLDGVSCVPAENGSTLWYFKCDDHEYPARLTNLPCPVEVHKTHDHATFYKCNDVGQILIVYDNMTSLEEAENLKEYKVDGFPSYYHSGLSPPMKRVVQRRFKAREHKSNPYAKDEVMEVMVVLRNLIAQIRPDTAKTKTKKTSTNVTSQDTGKEIIVTEDVEVDFEPWMTENGKVPKGIEFDETHALCYKHPELWLGPGENIVEEPPKKKEKKRNKDHRKTTSSRKSMDGDMNINAMNTSMSHTTADNKPTSSHKKGIPAKKNREDDLTEAAMRMKANDDTEDLFADLLSNNDFNFDEDSDLFNMDQNA